MMLNEHPFNTPEIQRFRDLLHIEGCAVELVNQPDIQNVLVLHAPSNQLKRYLDLVEAVQKAK